MNDSFRRGAFIGSILGASIAAYTASRINFMQKIKIKRNAKKAISNMKDGINLLWK